MPHVGGPLFDPSADLTSKFKVLQQTQEALNEEWVRTISAI
jgi:hypothetical protein